MAVLPLASSALAPMLLRRPPLRSGLAARPRLSRSTHRPGLFLGRPTSVTVYARGGGSGRGRDGGRSPSPSGRGGRGGPSGPPPPRWGTPLDIFGRLNLKTQPKTLDSSQRAAHPGPGKAGIPTTVLTNLFKLDVNAVAPVHQYSVEVAFAPAADTAAPADGKKRGARGVKKASREEASDAVKALAAGSGWADAFVYDGAAQLFSTRDDLGAEGQEVEVGSGASQQRFKVKLSKVSTMDVKQEIMKYVSSGGAPEALANFAPARAALEALTKSQAAASPAAVRTPTGYLAGSDKAEGDVKIGSRLLQILRGFSSSIKVAKTGTDKRALYMAVDHKAGAVLQDGPLLQVLLKVTGKASVQDLSMLSKKSQQPDVDGIQVRLTHTGFKTRLAGFSTQSARDFKFKLKEGDTERQLSVEQFCKERYGVVLKHPTLPVVLARNGAAFPMELCEVVAAQRAAQMKDARQQADLIRRLGKHAVVPPQERLALLKKAMAKQLGAMQGAVAKTFGLKLINPKVEPEEVPARLIPGPLLEYKGGKSVTTNSDGAWFPPGVPVKEPGEWKSGAVLVLLDKGRSRAGVERLMTSLKAQMSKLGCALPASAPVLYGELDSKDEVQGFMEETVEEAKRACRGVAPELLLVVLPDRGGDEVRNEVKRVGHNVLGVATQCLDPVKAGVTREARQLDQYCGNVALKLNTKLGGTTAELGGSSGDWAPFLGTKHFMVIGADVSRSITAVKGTRTALTYAGVVATQDRNAVRLSEPKMLVQVGKNDDLIYGMKDAAVDLIKNYARANNGSVPEVIVVYRDGVSESFYDQVLATEFTAIKEAAQSLDPKYNPKITFVVVSRSHGMRLFPADGQPAHRSGNVLPGTVVDNAMIDPFAFEYLLNSHAGIIGTNRVPKYTVLVDEYGFTSDAMQIFTHWLCHTYSLCHRAVSVPPVAKYADKVAEEARVLGEDTADGLVKAASRQQLTRDYELLRPQAMSGRSSMSFV